MPLNSACRPFTPGIQTAIDNSKNGDVILVSPGVYVGNIDFKGKAITVTSTNAFDPAVVQNTIIHGVGHASVVRFSSGEKSNSILAGFTITGGFGTVNSGYSTNVYRGGGIYCYLSSPTIVGNIVTMNSGPDGSVSDIGYGGGIACLESEAFLSRNRITANYSYAAGGIVSFLGKPKIIDNLIDANSAVVGGGVALLYGAQFMNNTVLENDAEFAGNLCGFGHRRTNSDPEQHRRRCPPRRRDIRGYCRRFYSSRFQQRLGQYRRRLFSRTGPERCERQYLPGPAVR